MNKNTQRKINSIGLFLSSFLYFFLAYIGFKEQKIDLTKQARLEGVIIDKGVDYHYSSKSKAKCFFFQLKGTPQKLGVYRASRNYSDLLDKFNIGDTVTAYFKRTYRTSENINIDLLQVEKAGKILLDKKEYERKESSLIYLGLAAGILSLILSYYYYKKWINSTTTVDSPPATLPG